MPPLLLLYVVTGQVSPPHVYYYQPSYPVPGADRGGINRQHAHTHFTTTVTAMKTAVVLLLITAAVNSSPAPLASYWYSKGYDRQAPWRAAWVKGLHKQRTPQANIIPQENKIPSWANPWTSQPGEGLLRQPSSAIPSKRSALQNGRMPFRFRLYKNEDHGLNADMKKRSYNAAQWFRLNKDTADELTGLDYVPRWAKGCCI